MQPLISIILPAYNAKSFIARSIESVLQQTYTNIELIIIDDGSSDNTFEVASGFTDPRVRVYRNKNHGVSHARNYGIEHSHGKYITFIDADDWYSPAHIRNMYQFMAGEVSMVATNFTSVGEDGQENIHDRKTVNDIGLDAEEAFFQTTELETFQGYVWNKLFQRQIIHNSHIRFNEDVAIWEDMLFVCEYLQHVKKVKYLSTPTYFYKSRSDSVVNTKDFIKEASRMIALRRILELSMKYSGDRKRHLFETYENSLFTSTLSKRKHQYLSSKLGDNLIKSDLKHNKEYLSTRNKIVYYAVGIFPPLKSVIRFFR